LLRDVYKNTPSPVYFPGVHRLWKGAQEKFQKLIYIGAYKSVGEESNRREEREGKV
jgi:hypothetical protein